MDTGYNIERFGSIFSDIRKYLLDLEELDIRGEEDLIDKRNFYATSMILFSLLNRVFDLGSEMAISHNTGIPSSNREIFVLLQKDGLIEPGTRTGINGACYFPESPVTRIPWDRREKLFLLTKKVGIIREFVDLMKKTIQDQKPR